ncbi:hypothetical protein Shyd_65410 [Streptomyces hydrogenans]|uniref:DUF4314 domain-containing protein n=2 Tax=Streptomyces hydrogenans TaxID=1873719 RepID=A0ABQ3PJG4_9ACTN|nr:hypothetical protein GCM10018784_23790 [Streptomyces hydrogenans]GHI25170.1 hypothetical protein Shyd_65410 [Streptomyces hydrogenans]
MASDARERFSRLEWMGRRVQVRFAPHWPVPIGNYVFDGFDEAGIWVSHDHNGQRHIIWHDIDEVILV